MIGIPDTAFACASPYNRRLAIVSPGIYGHDTWTFGPETEGQGLDDLCRHIVALFNAKGYFAVQTRPDDAVELAEPQGDSLFGLIHHEKTGHQERHDHDNDDGDQYHSRLDQHWELGRGNIHFHSEISLFVVGRYTQHIWAV